MPAFEAVSTSPSHSLFTVNLDNLRVRLPKNLGVFSLFPGTSLGMPEQMRVLKKEIPLEELFGLFGKARRLVFPHIVTVSADVVSAQQLMTVRMAGHHEVNLAQQFWRRHGGRVVVRTSNDADVVKLNTANMKDGFLIPPKGIDTVVFEALHGF